MSVALDAGRPERANDWSRNEVDLLRSFAAEGKTRKQTSEILGNRTEFAVAGKARELGIKWQGVNPRDAGFWTPEKGEQVRALAAQGLTSGKIGAEIGATSSMVIGYCGRRGIELRFKKAQAAAYPTADRRVVLKKKEKPAEPEPPASNDGNPIPKPDPKFLDKSKWDDGVGIDVTQLRRVTCRYPLGNVRDISEFYCGKQIQAKSVYCPDHHRRCYAAPQPRKRR